MVLLPITCCVVLTLRISTTSLLRCQLKGGGTKLVEYAILEECTDASLFLQFVRVLLEKSALSRDDIFTVHNYTIHRQGDNIGIQEKLFQNHGILMMTLPPYNPDFILTKLVFQNLLWRLSADRTRYKSLDVVNFSNTNEIEMENFNLQDVIYFFRKCG